MVERIVRHLICQCAAIEAVKLWALSVVIQDGELANLRVSQVQVVAANTDSNKAISNHLCKEC